MEFNTLVALVGSRLLGLLTIFLYSSLASLKGRGETVCVCTLPLYGAFSPRSIKPTTCLACVVAPLRLVTHTSIRNICTCEFTIGRLDMAFLKLFLKYCASRKFLF